MGGGYQHLQADDPLVPPLGRPHQGLALLAVCAGRVVRPGEQSEKRVGRGGGCKYSEPGGAGGKGGRVQVLRTWRSGWEGGEG